VLDIRFELIYDVYYDMGHVNISYFVVLIWATAQIGERSSRQTPAVHNNNWSQVILELPMIYLFFISFKGFKLQLGCDFINSV